MNNRTNADSVEYKLGAYHNKHNNMFGLEEPQVGVVVGMLVEADYK